MRENPIILGIETSCDETSAAVLRGDELLSNVISSQIEIHRRFGGVVPEIASRNHLTAILPVIDEALDKAGVCKTDLDAIGVTLRRGACGRVARGRVRGKGARLRVKYSAVRGQSYRGAYSG